MLTENRITRPCIWLSRIFHCRGFGIQSPNDYAFVRYVVNEQWPYYAYESLGNDDDWRTRKVGRLLFRMANWMQPGTVLSSAYDNYIAAGCRKCRFVPAFGQQADLVVVSPDSLDAATPDELEKQLTNAGDALPLLVIDHLQQNKALWKAIISHPKATAAFDLYYCGIVFFGQKREKQHYIVNF